MKTTALLVSSLAAASGFQSSLSSRSNHAATVTTTTNLAMGNSSKSKNKNSNPLGDLFRRLTNNFEPFHGHGSLENDLDEQWEAQQEILRNRRAHHLDKAHLKQKYSDPSKVRFDGKVGDSPNSEFGKDL